MFSLTTSEQSDFYTPIPHGRGRKRNHDLGVPTLAMFILTGGTFKYA